MFLQEFIKCLRIKNKYVKVLLLFSLNIIYTFQLFFGFWPQKLKLKENCDICCMEILHKQLFYIISEKETNEFNKNIK